MSPEFDLNQLSVEELQTIISSEETTLRKLPLIIINAAILLRCRNSTDPEIQNMASEPDRWVLDLPEEEIANIQQILTKE